MNDYRRNFYQLDTSLVLDYFEVSFKGLNANQIEESLKKHGKNEIREKALPSKARVFLEQFQDLLVIILIIAALISLFTKELESTIVIFSVITLNAIIGTYQHFKAEKSLKSLKNLASPHAKVIRSSTEMVIKSSDVVVGDIVIISAGDVIPADGRIISSESFEVNESSLTGESLSVEKNNLTIDKKDLVLADRLNMVFSGTIATNGSARIVVTNVGMDSEIGKIAGLLAATANHQTPLQRSLDDFSKKLAIIIITICIIIFILSLYRNISMLDSLMFAVALAVAAIPEALSSIVTIVLAIGTSKMAEENAIIKELKAVEGLGCINVICSDKTGTLTQNKMEVNSVYIDGRIINKESLEINNSEHRLFVLTALLCNDSSSQKVNATEDAIYDFASFYIPKSKFKNLEYPRVASLPFDSTRKAMSTLNKIDGKTYLFTKGAPEVIMNKATNIYINGKVRRLSVGDKYEIKQTIKGLSSEGNRCLALTYKEFDQVSSQNVELTSKDEDNLTFLGLITLVDPPRLEARLAITESLLAGIKPIMITGDHELTAVAIAKEVGIFKDGDLSLIGNDLDKVSDNALLKNIEQISVYARVSPVHKIRIVKAWQSHGAVVAFVGDGVNDGPAIREANIGISMGKSGTEVSKEASSIILTDDNYYTIIKAVRNGRKIYINIQNAITFLISGNAAAIFLVVYTSLLNLTLPFAPVHLLFINLLTDSLPAIAIGMEDSHDDLLKKPPRKTTDSLLSKRILQIIVFEGILIAIFTLLSYYLGLKSSPYVARTMVFGTLCMARLFHSFNCRGSKSIFKNKVKNKAMIISFIVGMVLINLVLFSPPLQPIFHSYELNNLQTIMIFVNAIMPTVILQLILIFRYRRRRY